MKKMQLKFDNYYNKKSYQFPVNQSYRNTPCDRILINS